MDKRIGSSYLKYPVRPEPVEANGAYPSTGSARTAYNNYANVHYLITPAIIFLLLICSVMPMYAGITLRITDAQGHELEQVAAGQPFTVEVMIADMGSQVSGPSIQGDSRITLQNRGQHISSINGATTAKYLYQGRIDEPGEYMLGPVTVVQAGQSISSNSMYITVGTTQKTIGKQRKKDSEDVLFELSLDKKRVFVGECTPVTLIFYYLDNTIVLKNITQPAVDGFILRGDVNNYTQGQEKIKGSLYNYIRWEWQLCPTKSGNLTIPAYGAEYEKLASNSNRFGLELFFAGRAHERLRIYSNALSMQVDPLPPYSGAVTAVGVFKQVTAMVEPSVAQEGDALVLTIEFEGEGDLQAIKTPELHGMPEALKYYDSKYYIVPSEDKNQFPKKRFEYIVQGLRTGTWQIPAQEFVIFDVKKKAYKKFKTEPVTITITPNAAIQKEGISGKGNSSVEEPSQKAADELLPIDEVGLWYRVPERTALPLWLFLLLSMLSGLYVLAKIAWHLMKIRASLHEPIIRAKKAFVNARSALERAHNINDVTQIYTIFTQLLADRYQINIKEATQDFIEKKLQDAGMSAIDRTEWHDFFMRATESAYGRKTMDKNSLFAQAQLWIDKLEELI